MCLRRYHSEAMCAKICALVLLLLPALPLQSQGSGSQDQAAQHSRQAQQYLAQHRPEDALDDAVRAGASEEIARLVEEMDARGAAEEAWHARKL